MLRVVCLLQDLRSQGPMCRALCAVEMLSLQNNGLPEFTGTCPSLSEVSMGKRWLLMLSVKMPLTYH